MAGLIITFLIIVVSILLLFMACIFAESPYPGYIQGPMYSPYYQMPGRDIAGGGFVRFFVFLMLVVMFLIFLRFYGGGT